MSGATPTRSESPPRFAVVDYGAGNLVSIEQALVSAGAAVVRATGPDDLRDADALVVPGVGAAAPAMERRERAGLVEPIRRWIADDRPFLGICLGLQLLFEGSDEDGAATLGVLRGRTRRLVDRAPSVRRGHPDDGMPTPMGAPGPAVRAPSDADGAVPGGRHGRGARSRIPAVPGVV